MVTQLNEQAPVAATMEQLQVQCDWLRVSCYHVKYSIPYSRNLLQEEIFVNLVILLSEEIFAIFKFNY